jgi:hypothetical protein
LVARRLFGALAVDSRRSSSETARTSDALVVVNLASDLSDARHAFALGRRWLWLSGSEPLRSSDGFVVLTRARNLAYARDALSSLWLWFRCRKRGRCVVIVFHGFFFWEAHRAVVSSVGSGHDVLRLHLALAVWTSERLGFRRALCAALSTVGSDDEIVCLAG